MSKLSKNQEAFIALMQQSDDQSRYGFNLINNKENLLDFYDALSEKGFFDFEKIIISGAHDYLQKAMNKSASTNNVDVINKILCQLRRLTQTAQEKSTESIDENYWIVFARIFAETPPSSLPESDIILIDKWLKMIKMSLTDAGIITILFPKLLESTSQADHIKACLLIKYCINVNWINDKFTNKKIPKFKISDYCIKSMFKNNAHEIGVVCGKEACKILIEKLKELTAIENAEESWVWLPAIEEHPQNIMDDECKLILVFGLRDILLAWFSSSSDVNFIKNLIDSNIEILERIAIFIFTEKFDALKSLFDIVINSKFLNRNHIHEIYHFMNRKFVYLDEAQKQALINCIKNLPVQENSKDPEAGKNYLQQRLLHAIFKKGSIEADELYLSLESKLGPAPDHPDFYVFIESWRSNDDSPYDAKELTNFLYQGELITKLNNFKITDDLRSPNTRGLVRALEEAIKSNPAKFILYKDDFLQADSPYQYGFINGYFELWKTDKASSSPLSPLWNEIWRSLFDFFNKLVFDRKFWNFSEDNLRDLTPKKSWIPPLIADFLRSGMHADDKAFSEDLLPKAYEITKCLLSNLASEHRADTKDAMTIAINSAKGKAIETLVYYSLRTCRLSEKKSGSHNTAWVNIVSSFDEELAKCQNDNYEFSTLMASYIENLNYLSHEWLENNLPLLFSFTYLNNFSSAVQGLAYTQGASSSVYYLLRDHGVFEFAINEKLLVGEAKKQLMNRIALAYLWGDETLDSKIFTYLYENNCIDELSSIAFFYWSIQNQDISTDYLEKIINFWRKSLLWCENRLGTSLLLAKLGVLSCYLNELDEEKKKWLVTSAPHITSASNEMHFLQNLLHLVEKSPVEVLDVLDALLISDIPHYDIGDYLKSILRIIGENKDESIRKRNLMLCNKLRNLPGFQDLYNQLTENSR